MTELDPRALKAARTAYQSAIPDGCWHTDGGETDAPIRAAITAYLALSQPQAGEPVSWGVFARAICESEGRNWTALDNPREDCERWIKAGQACAALVSPQPANPAQVTDAMVEAAVRAYDKNQPFEASVCDSSRMRAALTAAIGAGGQAVAWPKVKCSDGVARALPEWLAMFRRLTGGTGFLWLAKDADKFASVLSQPHPDNARLSEALRSIAEGNLGDCPWQANYDRIREVARAALSGSGAGGWRVVPTAKTLDDWHEDDGFVVWWTWQDEQWLGEPSYIGSPLCSDWPGYHTHWTPHPAFPAAPTATGGRS